MHNRVHNPVYLHSLAVSGRQLCFLHCLSHTMAMKDWHSSAAV